MPIKRGKWLPVAIKMFYYDSTVVPEGEVIIQIKKDDQVLGETSQETDTLWYDPKTSIYWTWVPTTYLEPGSYDVVVLRDGPWVGERSFYVYEGEEAAAAGVDAAVAFEDQELLPELDFKKPKTNKFPKKFIPPFKLKEKIHIKKE